MQAKNVKSTIRIYCLYYYNQSAVIHYGFNTHPCCKKLSENKFTKASEQTLDRQQQNLALYANIWILLKDLAYNDIYQYKYHRISITGRFD